MGAVLEVAVVQRTRRSIEIMHLDVLDFLHESYAVILDGISYHLRANWADAFFYLTLLMETMLLAISSPHSVPVQSIPVFIVNPAYNIHRHLF